MANVYVSTREYERNHGARPRGFGSWAFVPENKANRADYLSFVKWFHQMNYSEAKRAAAKAFAAEGVFEVEVCS